ncbi:MAG: adenylyl-sulfate kinase, partial [Lachnospiraceae bacterium]|nr:adenylyl-sulfate kinase [Lachnospiraceae bacterium]
MDGLLKFITCGSVDDGKSTLIGHMLYDAKLLYADQVQALELDSRVGSNDGKMDYSLLLDGLMAEREQGITIDVAYRYFTTDRRSFIVADCPGHEQYTRNMAVGASFAELAVILVDASKGVSIQTRRHTMICHLMGIRHVVLAVNKMDLVHYSQRAFDAIGRDFRAMCVNFDLASTQVIPLSATEGDNITHRSANCAWYQGPTLLDYLETVDVSDDTSGGRGMILPIQRVCRPHQGFRGFQGQIDTGSLAVGDVVTALPNRHTAIVTHILRGDGEVQEASAGMAVTVQLDREIDVSRGSVLFRDVSPDFANLLNATVLWMDEKEMMPGSGYLLKCGTKTVPATVMNIKHKIDINTGQQVLAQFVNRNDIVSCDIALGDPIVFMPFEQNRTMGAFILIDRVSNMTSACGVIQYSLRRSGNLQWQHTDITRQLRAAQKGQTPLTLWFTGLSGAGKSTLANEIERRLYAAGRHTMLLDGDNVRMGLNQNLG